MVISVNCFLISPVSGAGAVMWILIAMPSLALCLRREHLPAYIKCFGAVIIAYAIGLVVQMLFHNHIAYTEYTIPGRYAWPLMDPNNGAAVLNMALIPSVWLTLFKDLRWSILSILLAAAMYATGSKTGFVCFGSAAFILISVRFGLGVMLMMILAGIAESVAIFLFCPEYIVEFATCFRSRYPIWEVTWMMLQAKPLFGLGLGMFGPYYHQFRIETYTAGWYAHNDFLQFGVEMGVASAIVFALLFLTIGFKANKTNLPATLVAMSVFLGSMMEFQFYVPAISLPMGLVIAYHMRAKCR